MTSEAELAAIRERLTKFCSVEEPSWVATEELLFDLDALLNRVEAMRATLVMARAEIDRWGYGDFHYGSTPREQSVLDALAAIDEVLS